jgi:hypothetical protein
MKFENFYHLAKLGGEGWGMAYEYRVKWELLEKFFGDGRVRKVLIAGLPEKYGLSMDFLVWAKEKGATVVVIDEREKVVEKLKRVLKKEWLPPSLKLRRARDIVVKCRSMLTIDTVGRFDLVLNCEVLQRIPEKLRGRFLRRCLNAAKKGAFFVPNGGNENHAKISGLETMGLEELFGLGREAKVEVLEGGYIDMPPFPPGKSLEKKQRENVILKTILPVGLEIWARIERFFPEGYRQKNANLVYGIFKK